MPVLGSFMSDKLVNAFVIPMLVPAYLYIKTKALALITTVSFRVLGEVP